MIRQKQSLIFFMCLYLVTGFLPTPAKADWLGCGALSEDSSYKDRESLKFLVPGQEPWLFISQKDFMMDFSLTQETLRLFSDFKNALKAKGTDLVLVVVPQRGLFHADQIDRRHPLAQSYDPQKARASYGEMILSLSNAGLAVNQAPDFTQTDYGHERDHHWNDRGAFLIAQNLTPVIQKLENYASVSKQKFIYEEGAPLTFKGSFFNPVRDICGKDLPVKQVTQKTAIPEGGDLFATQKADIVLVGTSFSEEGKSYANFVDHLRVLLSAAVDNRAMGGGGMQTALHAYLASEDFKAQPPKILIWEIPGFYSLNRSSILKESIRLVEAHDK